MERNYYLDKLILKKNNGMIKVITGARRCGKTYLLMRLFYNWLLSQDIKESQIILVSLGADESKGLINIDKLHSYVRERINKAIPSYILIDNLETFKDHEAVFNSFISKNIDVYVTGSSEKLLPSELTTYLRGRVEYLCIYPLTFKELYKNENSSDNLDDFIHYGGMPELIELEGDEQKRKYLKDLLKEYYIGGIIKNHKVKQLDVLEKVVDILISRIGSFSTSKEIEEVLKTFSLKATDDTVGRCVGYILESFLFMKTKRFDIKNKKYSIYQYKYYCVDHGLRNTMDSLENLSILNIMRNIIYIELLSREYSVGVGIVPVKMEKSYEVDFIASKGAKIAYIQVAYALESSEKVFELTKAFSKIKDNFRKIIVTYDRTKFTTLEDGYERIDLISFLLNVDYLN